MRQLSFLSKVTAIGLGIMGVEILLNMRLAGVLVPAGLVFAVLPLVVAVLITFGVRWMPALGAGLAALVLAFVLQNPTFMARVTHPEMGISFVLAIVRVAGADGWARTGATVLNYRRRQASTAQTA